MAKTSLYLNEKIQKKILMTEDIGLSTAVGRIIDRLDLIIKSEEAGVKSIFTDEEMNALRNMTNGTIWEPAAVIRGGLLADCQDSLDEEIEGYGATRAVLEKKLAKLTVVQQVVLVDMLERWWANVSNEKGDE